MVQWLNATHISKIALIVASLVSSSLGAGALDRKRLLSLEVTAGPNDGAEQSFGTLSSFMRRLRQAGHSCELDSYAYGGSIDCGKKNEPPSVLIHFEFEPTRAPEIAHVDSIRANGINGGETPAAEQVKFLSEFSKAKPTSSPK